MTLLRVLRTAQTVLTHTFYVDETATDSSVDVTVSVKRLNGTVVASGTASDVGVGQYAFTVPGQANVDMLTVDWSGTVGGAAVTARDYVEVVGGFLFGLAEAREQPPPLDPIRYPTATLARKRLLVEQEAEIICGRAFTRQFGRAVVSGTGRRELLLNAADVVSVRAVSVGGVAYDSGALAGVHVMPGGVISAGYGTWPEGFNNVIIEYEHGADYPPEPVREAGMVRLRSRLTSTDSGVPLRAVSWQAGAEGGVYRIALPTREQTGIPEVDSAYARASWDIGGFA